MHYSLVWLSGSCHCWALETVFQNWFSSHLLKNECFHFICQSWKSVHHTSKFLLSPHIAPMKQRVYWCKVTLFNKNSLQQNIRIKSKSLSAPKLKLHWQLIKNILPLWFLALEELLLSLNIDWNVPGQRIGLILNLKKFTPDNTC